jgi:hypothetical protein
MKMIVGSTWKAKTTAYLAPSAPSTVVMMRGQTSLSPSGPNTMLEPANVKPRSQLITPPSVWKMRRPAAVFSTSRANTTCRVRPQATVRRSIARRLMEIA